MSMNKIKNIITKTIDMWQWMFSWISCHSWLETSIDEPKHSMNLYRQKKVNKWKRLKRRIENRKKCRFTWSKHVSFASTGQTFVVCIFATPKRFTKNIMSSSTLKQYNIEMLEIKILTFSFSKKINKSILILQVLQIRCDVELQKQPNDQQQKPMFQPKTKNFFSKKTPLFCLVILYHFSHDIEKTKKKK